MSDEEVRVRGDVVGTIGFMREWIKEHEKTCEVWKSGGYCAAREGAVERLRSLEKAQEREYARKLMKEAEDAGIVVSTKREADVDEKGVTVTEEITVRTKEKDAREECYEGFQREYGRIQEGEAKVPLGITERVETHIQLSTGGPGDGFKLWRTEEGEWVAGEYYYVDWGVREALPLSEEEIDEIVAAYGLEGRSNLVEPAWYEGD